MNVPEFFERVRCVPNLTCAKVHELPHGGWIITLDGSATPYELTALKVAFGLVTNGENDHSELVLVPTDGTLPAPTQGQVESAILRGAASIPRPPLRLVAASYHET